MTKIAPAVAIMDSWLEAPFPVPAGEIRDVRDRLDALLKASGPLIDRPTSARAQRAFGRALVAILGVPTC